MTECVLGSKKCSYMDLGINDLDVKKNMWTGTVDGKKKQLDMRNNDCAVSLSEWTNLKCGNDMFFKIATIKNKNPRQERALI